ncbi:MAG TPA: VOC family protein [Pyrinomonadaceae bacterium]|nr:VOC family protein [Pyrinomonadaceae bacterium]
MIRFRYMVNDVEEAVEFYTKLLGFEVKQTNLPYFAMLRRDGVDFVLSPPFGPGGAAKPMKDGSKPEAGTGWNRLIINVEDLSAEVERRGAKVKFRSDVLTGPGGSEVLLEDPSGNPVELFQPAAESAGKSA